MKEEKTVIMMRCEWCGEKKTIAQLCYDTTCNVCAQSRWEHAQEFNAASLPEKSPLQNYLDNKIYLD